MAANQEQNSESIDLQSMSRESMVGIINNMAFRFSEEVDSEPEELISDSYKVFKETANKFHFEVNRGSSGYSGDYKTLEEGMERLSSYVKSFDNNVTPVRINIVPINR